MKGNHYGSGFPLVLKINTLYVIGSMESLIASRSLSYFRLYGIGKVRDRLIGEAFLHFSDIQLLQQKQLTGNFKYLINYFVPIVTTDMVHYQQINSTRIFSFLI